MGTTTFSQLTQSTSGRLIRSSPLSRGTKYTAEEPPTTRDNISPIYYGLKRPSRNTETFPVNVIFLLEGEEESAAPISLPSLTHRESLACDICAVSDTGMIGPGIPTLTYGLRGIACLDFKIHGPSLDLHSGVYGGAVPNPATIVSRIISSLHDENEIIQIPAFYDSVTPLEPWERDMWASLPDGDATTLEETGAAGLLGEAGHTALEQRWGRPTAEVNGVGGGYQGEGSKTVIPREAMAKLSFRPCSGTGSRRDS